MKTPTPTADDIAELVAFLPRLYAPGFSPAMGWGGGRDEETGVMTLSWPQYAEVVGEFVEAASKECWSDGEFLHRDVNGILAREGGVASLGIDEIRSVLTFCIRGERFCDGHWAAMIEAGHVRRVLERLAELGSERTEGRAARQKRLMQELPWSEDLQQQTRDALEELSTPPDGLLHVKHKALGYAAINMLEFLQNGLLACASGDGRRWEYPDVEALLTAGWVID